VLRYAAMGDTSVRLSDEHLRLLVEACRIVAGRYARDADHQRDPIIRRVLVDAAAELGALGDRLQETYDRTRAARLNPMPPEPPPRNVTPLRR
jgi:hypothetical protein